MQMNSRCFNRRVALMAAVPILMMSLLGATDMTHVPGHMFMTTLRPLQPGDQQKADSIVVAARAAMAPYADYRKALADGYRIFLPDIPQPQYHFTNYDFAKAARSAFDPGKPTSLLYKKTADGGYQLVGAMYTAAVDADEAELNSRIPLSIARWHQHINFCKAPPDQKALYFGPNAKFGLLGSRSSPKKIARPRVVNFIRTYLVGWFMSIPTKPIQTLYGRQTTTARVTTIWTTMRCQA